MKSLIESLKKNIDKIMLGGTSIVFFASMLPIFILSYYDRPAFDDFSYADYSHAAWVDTHSVWATLMSQFTKVHDVYFNWQGTWLSVFLFGLHPSVFSFRAYALVPWIMIALISVSTTFFLYEIFVKRIGFTKVQFAVVDLLVLFMFFQYEPYVSCAIYWWVGCCHYVVPFSLGLFAIALTSKYLRERKIRHLVCLTVCLALVGGGNYLAAFFAPLAMLLVVILSILSLMKSGEKFLGAIKKCLPILIPVACEIIGLLTSALAPGNFVRADLEMDSGMIFSVLGQAFAEGSLDVFRIPFSNPVSSCVLLILICFVYSTLRRNRAGNGVSDKTAFSHPILFVVYTFIARCLIYWPPLFAGDEVSGGVFNMYYQTLILMLLMDGVYVIGYFLYRREKREKSYGSYVLPIAFVIAAIIVLFPGRKNIYASAGYEAYHMLTRGGAAIYYQEMELQNWLLTDETAPGRTKDSAFIPVFGEDHSPLSCMLPSEIEGKWANTAFSRYYRIDYVLGVNSKVWSETYGLDTPDKIYWDVD